MLDRGTAPAGGPRLALHPLPARRSGDMNVNRPCYNHRILLFDSEHTLLGVLGTGQRGRGADAIYRPEAVLARAPNVWVLNTYNDRIVLLRIE